MTDTPEQSGWRDMDEPEREESPSGATSGDEPLRTRPAPSEDLLARTRTSQIWIGIIVFALVLILLLIFILENTQRVKISYFGASSNMPLAVAMLLSAVAGVLLTAIAGTVRIFQLRHRVRKGQRGR